MTAGDLTTLADLRQWLTIPDAVTDDDELLTRAISAVSAAIQTYLNRTIAQASYTDTRNGNGGYALSFGQYPVSAVASLSIDGNSIPASSSPTTPGYVFSPTQLLLRCYRFCTGVQNVTFTYTAGYVSTPLELAQACIEWISLRYRERDRIGQRSKSVGGETISYFIGAMPDSCKLVLNNWRKVIPA